MVSYLPNSSTDLIGVGMDVPAPQLITSKEDVKDIVQAALQPHLEVNLRRKRAEDNLRLQRILQLWATAENAV